MTNFQKVLSVIMFASNSEYLSLIVSAEAGLRHPYFGLPETQWEARKKLIGKLCYQMLFPPQLSPEIYLVRFWQNCKGMPATDMKNVLAYVYLTTRAYECETRWSLITRCRENLPTWLAGKGGLYEYHEKLTKTGFRDISVDWLFSLDPYIWDEDQRRQVVSGTAHTSENLIGVCNGFFREVVRFKASS